MSTADRLVERGATKLQQLSRSLASRGGVAETVASDLSDDAAFLRKLKPSLIIARARGESSRDGNPSPEAPAGPQIERPKPKKTSGGVNPLLVVGGALVAGIVIAKLIDYRGHAHPRD